MLYLDTGYRLTETRPTIGCGSREARWEGRRAGRGSSFLFQGFIYLGLVWGKDFKNESEKFEAAGTINGRSKIDKTP